MKDKIISTQFGVYRLWKSGGKWYGYLEQGEELVQVVLTNEEVEKLG